MNRSTISESNKYQILVQQSFQCRGIPNYKCPFLGRCFDESGYDIDHILALADGGSNHTHNLQALCACCHRVKTMRENKARDTKKTEEDRKYAVYKQRFQTFRSTHPLFVDTNTFWSAYDAWQTKQHVFSSKKVILALAKEAYGF